MLADFLGKGWSFPVVLDDHGAIKVSQGEKSIQDSIWIILATSPGERVMRPTLVAAFTGSSFRSMMPQPSAGLLRKCVWRSFAGSRALMSSMSTLR